MSPTVFITTLCIVFGSIIVIFAIRAGIKSKDLQLKRGTDDFEAQTAASLMVLQTTLEEVRGRLVSIERILKQVE